MNKKPKSDIDIANTTVRLRKVYFISGFDPRGAAYYHRLYKEEAKKQSVLNCIDIEVGARRKIASHQYQWAIKSVINQQCVNTEYSYLGWDDIVREHWETNGAKLIGQTAKGYWRFTACGALGRIRKLYRGPFYSGIYPILFLFIAILISLIFGGLLADLLIATSFPFLVVGAVCLASMFACYYLAWKIADYIGVLWLLRTNLFVYFWGESTPNKLSERVEIFAKKIVNEQIKSPYDEIILIGHSVGSIVAVSVLARALALSAEKLNLSLVTLGQCIPVLSLIPSAASFRQDLKTLALQPNIPWLDVVARADPLCFAEVNPISVSGIDSPSVQWPKQQIMRPFKMFSPQQYNRIKRNKLRLHFQYLMSSEYQTDYDFFLLTAGSVRLNVDKSSNHSF